MIAIRDLLLAFALLAAPAAFGQEPTRPAADARGPEPRPNIVFILSDDHRWDALGAAGNARIHTPTLDRLAREGVYFRQATVFVSQCMPSRAVLMTGLPPHASGIYSIQAQRRDLWWQDSLAMPVVPALLRDAGYRTVLVGKWHLQSDPWKTGFSDVRTWLEEGVASYRNPRLSQGNDRRRERREGFTNEIFTDDAVAFLRSDEAGEQPFLLWLALTAPHGPMQPNPEHIEHLYDGRTTADLLPPAFPADATPEDFLHYAEAVSLVDDLTSRVVAALDERGLAENTVIIFMGDNGHMMGSRGLSGKVVPYEESVRIPLIVVAPGASGFRGTSEAAVSSLDLPPTLLRLAGVEPPQEWPGRDLTPLLHGRAATAFEFAFGEWADDESWFGPTAYRLVRSARHKLVRWRRAGQPPELYDLLADPHETTNRYADPALRTTREQLERELDGWIARTDDPAGAWPPGGVVVQDVPDPEPDRDEVRALGVVVDPALLDEYAGRYEFPNRGEIGFEHIGGSLHFAESMAPAELIAASATLFLHPTQPFRFTFTRDVAGNVSGVTVRNRGYDRPARRLH